MKETEGKTRVKRRGRKKGPVDPKERSSGFHEAPKEKVDPIPPPGEYVPSEEPPDTTPWDGEAQALGLGPIGFVKVGPATRMVAVNKLGDMLGLSPVEARAMVDTLGVPTVEGSRGVALVDMFSFEVQLKAALLPGGLGVDGQGLRTRNTMSSRDREREDLLLEGWRTTREDQKAREALVLVLTITNAADPTMLRDLLEERGTALLENILGRQWRKKRYTSASDKARLERSPTMQKSLARKQRKAQEEE